jgi:cobalt/nickel transport system permease protein
MHMADALLSPTVGGVMWAATAATVAYSAKMVRETADDRKVPLMGVVGAFVFATQMINFAIPGTGASGHLGGGLILAIMLGPHAAFLTMASILTVQALFFADGGLLALGANIFNLGAFPCFVAYPFLFKPIAGRAPTPRRLTLASLVGAIAGLQVGAFGVVLETVLSGISELPFSSFVLLMQPIHLLIGIIEGLATAAVVSYVWKTDAGLLAAMGAAPGKAARSVFRKSLVTLGVVTLVTAATLSWFASTSPDGLEWSIASVTGSGTLKATTHRLHEVLAHLQARLSFLPHYGFRTSSLAPTTSGSGGGGTVWPAVDAGTSVAGVVGGILTLAVAGSLGWVLRKRPHPLPVDKEGSVL